MDYPAAQEAAGTRPVIFLAYVGFLLAILVALVVGYRLGEAQAGDDSGLESATHRAERLELREAQGELTEALAELDMLRTRYEVDRAALEMVRTEIAGQKESILDLEERLQFFRSLMAPVGAAQGLTVRPVELLAMAQPGRYAYRIIVQQEARKHELLQGVLDVAIFGEQGGEKISYPLGELNGEAEDKELDLRFRYFQTVEGELRLPQAFEPEGIRVEAKTTGPRKLEATEQFPWQLLEKFTHAGK